MTGKASTAANATRPATSADVRADLVEALRLDLIGPRPGDPAHAAYERERLRIAPSQWYLTGFLAPTDGTAARNEREPDEDILDQLAKRRDMEPAPERSAARRAYFPSSMGLTVLVAPSESTLEVQLSWGDYEPVYKTPPTGEGPAPRPDEWRRTPRVDTQTIDVTPTSRSRPYKIAGSGGLDLLVQSRTIPSGTRLTPGTRSVSVFLVNDRAIGPDGARDKAFVFQPELVVMSAAGFVRRPDLRTESSDQDESLADLQYRDTCEIAVGHNVSALAEASGDAPVHVARTDWMPLAEVEKVAAEDIHGSSFEMEALAAAANASALQAMLTPLADGYDVWVNALPVKIPGGDADRDRTAHDLRVDAQGVAARLRDGIASLSEPLALRAFSLANQAVATALRQRWAQEHPGKTPADASPPKWRPFQLAFLLVNLRGMIDPHHGDRQTVDLLFFPTGGGKTEAYLGLAAFTMVLRRLKDSTKGSCGVSVIMRYTLRLLTLDQLGRAAALICALELERQRNVSALGTWPFEIGLWVGEAATPNRMGFKGAGEGEETAWRRTRDYKAGTSREAPIPISSCPWCGTAVIAACFELLPDHEKPKQLRIQCVNESCAFHRTRQPLGLPIIGVDDEVYSRLPAFLIATVDKFASLPFEGRTAGLFGRVERYDIHGWHVADDHGEGTPLPQGLPPPDLIIQDELHLISGPLGTMVGLYETAIEKLTTRSDAKGEIHPKIIASTATVRRARAQIRALFGRTSTSVFPPPGPDRRNSFFAVTRSPISDPAKQYVGVPARQYVGIAAPGRSPKQVFLRTVLALLGASQKAYEAAGGARAAYDPSDPYRTLVAYFNALRELGGSRRIVEDEITSQVAQLGSSRLRLGETSGLFANRPGLRGPEELTSRVATAEVARTRRRLGMSASDKEGIDVALATNMIAVGLDVTRLGLMVVNGQPKTIAEYIQSTSRVGRSDDRPGLVVTLFNVLKPRDRSHYERFRFSHATFYRAVEATSVTPFSARAMDRGLAAISVTLARHSVADLLPPRGAERVPNHIPELDAVADAIAKRAGGHASMTTAQQQSISTRVRKRVIRLRDEWVGALKDNPRLQYGSEVHGATRLLYDPLDEDRKLTVHGEWFKAARSLRDVEPAVAVWIDPGLKPKKEES